MLVDIHLFSPAIYSLVIKSFRSLRCNQTHTHTIWRATCHSTFTVHCSFVINYRWRCGNKQAANTHLYDFNHNSINLKYRIEHWTQWTVNTWSLRFNLCTFFSIFAESWKTRTTINWMSRLSNEQYTKTIASKVGRKEKMGCNSRIPIMYISIKLIIYLYHLSVCWDECVRRIFFLQPLFWRTYTHTHMHYKSHIDQLSVPLASYTMQMLFLFWEPFKVKNEFQNEKKKSTLK